jgi:hypothetical protein
MDFRLILGFWNLNLCLQVVKKGLNCILGFFLGILGFRCGSRHGGDAAGVLECVLEEHLNVFLSQLER